jgi:hypothetical protein
MVSTSGGADHARTARLYRGSPRRIRRIIRDRKTPVGVWVLLAVTLLLVLALFSWFDRQMWPTQ